MSLFRSRISMVGSTERIGIYTDAVLAIIITILVLELHVPELHDASLHGVLQALAGLLPKFASFAFSFLTLSVFWVNHHHFFHELHRADGRLLWYNNALLFWLALVPFTTAFLGEHPFVPGVLALYCFVLFMSALSFTLMERHAMFVGDLLDEHITTEQKHEHFHRSLIGIVVYGAATLLALVFTPAALVLIVFVPLFFIAPRLMHDHEAMV